MKTAAAPLILNTIENDMSNKLKFYCNELTLSLETLKTTINKYETYKITKNKQIEIMENIDDRRD